MSVSAVLVTEVEESNREDGDTISESVVDEMVERIDGL